MRKKISLWINKHRELLTILLLSLSAIGSFILPNPINWIAIGILLINVLFLRRFARTTLIIATVIIGAGIYFWITSPINQRYAEAEALYNIRIGFHKELENATKENLNKVLLQVNLYKGLNGHFPSTLKEIKRHVSLNDVSYFLPDPDYYRFAEFYYEILDSNTIYLAAIGKDGKPKTEDDILPGK
jgi:hypothetical protein